MLSAAGSPTSATSNDSDFNLAHIFREVTDLHTIDFDQCGDALKFIMEPNPEEEYAEFLDVYYPVYSTVTDIIDLNWTWLPSRPRWSYFEDDRILLIEMRSFIHEAPLEHLSSIFNFFLDGFVRDDNPVLATIIMNTRLSSVSIVPDMAIQMDTRTENYRGHDVLVMVECAFAQDTDSVLRKIKYEIAGHPEVLMVILVVINEDQRYRSPERTSEAWRMLRQETSPRSISSFYSELQEDTARSQLQPIVIANHTWCHLASARFHIWVRGNEPINIDVDNSELQARGTLFPKQDMDAADTMIEKGMVMMRDCIATACQKATPGSDITAIQETVIAFRPKWDRLLMRLNCGAWDIAYHRYKSWYYSAP